MRFFLPRGCQPRSVASCTYPPRLFAASLLWPPLPQALAAYASLNVPGVREGLLGSSDGGAGFSAPYLTLGSAGQGGGTVASRPYLTSTAAAEGSAGTPGGARDGPTLLPEQQLSLRLPPPLPGAPTQQGAVSLDLPWARWMPWPTPGPRAAAAAAAAAAPCCRMLPCATLRWRARA